jgi:hypothetical protein
MAAAATQKNSGATFRRAVRTLQRKQATVVGDLLLNARTIDEEEIPK